MTREEVREFFARRQEVLARLDPAGLAALHTEDGVLESVMAGKITGRREIEQFYRSLFTSFPDFRWDPEELFIDGDRVVQTATFGGTDSGGFMGVPPTGKQMRIAGVFFFTFRDARIQHMRSLYDFTGLLVQIGVLKVRPT
jgi:steroid delta-isomerase-like uncharacterized protein